MANILLTNVCNLQCPYCFANDYTCTRADEITLEAFQAALDFVATSNHPGEKLGLIGGEPTLHSEFGRILDLLIEDDRFSYVHLFTNGICVKEFLPRLRHPKFHLLINCNCEEYMGARAYRVMCENIERLMSDPVFRGRVTLGINIAEPNFRYRYLLDLLKQHGMHTVRLAIASPNSDEKRLQGAFAYFEAVKPRLLEFLFALLENGIVPCYDCNKLPTCFLTEREKSALTDAMERLSARADELGLPARCFEAHDFAVHSPASRCYPAVDILQDLTALRCFGIGESSRVRIGDFATIGELRSYYLEQFDSRAYTENRQARCADCALRAEARCMGGCIAYTLDH